MGLEQVDVILAESQCKVHAVAAIKIPSRVTQAHHNADKEQQAHLAWEIHSSVKRQSTGTQKETNSSKTTPPIYLKSLKPQITWRGLWPQPNSKYEIRISNIEQGISNDEAFLSFDVHYSLFDIRYSLSNDKKLNAQNFT